MKLYRSWKRCAIISNYCKIVTNSLFLSIFTVRDMVRFISRAFKREIASSNILKRRTTASNSPLFSHYFDLYSLYSILYKAHFVKHPQTSHNSFKLVFFFSIPDPFPMFERILSITGARQEGLVVLN